MKRAAAALLTVLTVAAAASFAASPKGAKVKAVKEIKPAKPAAWGQNRLWNDGRAEVAVYDAERVVYGKARPFREELIVVAEDLDAQTLVKSDQPKKTKTVRVFKLNQAQNFDTENYPYSFMTSVFVKAENPRKVVKMTVGSQEWCGNTFKMLRSDADLAARLEWHSYFDGEADGRQDLVLEEKDLFEDQLPLALRGFRLIAGYSEEVRLWPSITSSHGGPIEPVKATITVEAEEPVRCWAGTLPSWKVTVKKPDGVDTFWFEKAYPHVMTRMEAADGRKRLLRGRVRWAYWDRRIPMPNILK